MESRGNVSGAGLGDGESPQTVNAAESQTLSRVSFIVGGSSRYRALLLPHVVVSCHKLLFVFLK